MDDKTPRDNYSNDGDDRESKKSSSIYEKVFPMRIPCMAIGGIVALIGLGMFIGGFAGLVADMDVKIRRTGAPNIGYLLMLIVSVAVMVGGGVSIFCGCGAIRYDRKKKEMEIARQNAYKIEQEKKEQMKLNPSLAAAASNGQTFTSARIRSMEPNGNVTYTVTYQYRGPPPGQINGLPAYPAPPSHISPTLKIDPVSSSMKMPPQPHQQQQKSKIKMVPQPPPLPMVQRIQAPPLAIRADRDERGREHQMALSNVPRKLVLIKRV